MLPLKNTSKRYGVISQLLHWSIATLFILNFYLVYRRDYFLEGDPNSLTYILLHKSVGALLLALGILFLCWRRYNAKPAWPHEMSRWEARAAKSTHHLLWMLILIMPISGLLMSGFAGRPVSFFGFFTLPAFVSPNEAWAGFLHTAHVWLSYLIIAMVSLHVLAALRHHFWLKDNVLRSMLPVKLK